MFRISSCGEEDVTNQEHKRILAVIPCYNEELKIGSIIHKTKLYVDDVVVVDDGSRDNTSQIAQEAGANVLVHKKNKGKSAAIRTGFRYALVNNFDYVITIDGDGQHNPEEIPILLKNVLENGFDISIGFRSGKRTEMPFWRKIGKRVLDYTTSLGGGGKVTDSQCGFRAFNKKAVQILSRSLNGESFTTESEQLIKANRNGLKVGEAPITCRYKDLDTSTKTPASHGFSVLGYIIWLVAQRRPLLFIGVPGFFIFLSGIILSIYTLQYYAQNQVFLISYAILIAILLIIGAIAIFMGVILNVLPKTIKQLQQENDEDFIFLQKK
jgi:glycosyltransferase involved in cell wall biosynthesis